MTWTPREDATLLCAKTSHRGLLTPALQQAQWQEVAFYVTASNGAVVRLADACQERYKALLEAARNTEKTQWPGDESLHKLLQAALEREGALRCVGPKAASSGAKENGRPGSAEVTGLAAPRAATSKRPRQDDAPTVLAREHDEIILRVAAETTSSSSEEWLWRKMTKCAKAESMTHVPAKVWKARYHELLEMNDEAIRARFEGDDTLCLLHNCARTLYESRVRLIGRGFADNRTSRPVTEATEMPIRCENRSELCRHRPIAIRSTVKTPAVVALQSSTPHTLEQETTRLEARASTSSQLELAASSNSSETSHTSPRPLVEGSSLSRQKDAPAAQQGHQASEEDMVELKKMVALMTSDLALISANVTQVGLENAELKKDVATLRVEVSQTNRELAATAKEMTTLRAKLEQANVDRMALQVAVEAKSLPTVATIQREWTEFQDEQREKIEEISSTLTAEIESLTMATAKAVDELSTRCRDATAAERERHAILFEIVETEILKREELADFLTKHQIKYETDKHDLAVKTEKLRAKCERDQQAREESMIWFQEEIQQELAKLRDEVKHEVSKNDRLLLTMQDELKSGLEGLQEAINRQQDEAKCHSLDQYVHMTLQHTARASQRH